MIPLQQCDSVLSKESMVPLRPTSVAFSPKGWGYSDIFYIHKLGSKFSFSVFFLVFNKNNFFGEVGDFCGYFLRVTSKFDYFYSYLFKSATVICIL